MRCSIVIHSYEAINQSIIAGHLKQNKLTVVAGNFIEAGGRTYARDQRMVAYLGWSIVCDALTYAADGTCQALNNTIPSHLTCAADYVRQHFPDVDPTEPAKLESCAFTNTFNEVCDGVEQPAHCNTLLSITLW